ncbi:hypothetical protein M427DRAFT_65924 [Gonapodya prolifera JEL478]|uniref:F-box domain-containing protein n=1 Tax=Gonapodya prolifera (strain JEL478) TaxID=1344416 RepID=A0A139AWN1_GONPJ|nr:hypothetical protein M427DRAFT_65924 [Gonapodya prolifera JEL478]|eukprot:KXS21128.1 hypothetical protein M427DRAFT_65924 [Gonapodya prolifera JEL478]
MQTHDAHSVPLPDELIQVILFFLHPIENRHALRSVALSSRRLSRLALPVLWRALPPLDSLRLARFIQFTTMHPSYRERTSGPRGSESPSASKSVRNKHPFSFIKAVSLVGLFDQSHVPYLAKLVKVFRVFDVRLESLDLSTALNLSFLSWGNTQHKALEAFVWACWSAGWPLRSALDFQAHSATSAPPNGLPTPCLKTLLLPLSGSLPSLTWLRALAVSIQVRYKDAASTHQPLPSSLDSSTPTNATTPLPPSLHHQSLFATLTMLSIPCDLSTTSTTSATALLALLVPNPASLRHLTLIFHEYDRDPHDGGTGTAENAPPGSEPPAAPHTSLLTSLASLTLDFGIVTRYPARDPKPIRFAWRSIFSLFATSRSALTVLRIRNLALRLSIFNPMNAAWTQGGVQAPTMVPLEDLVDFEVLRTVAGSVVELDLAGSVVRASTLRRLFGSAATPTAGMPTPSAPASASASWIDTDDRPTAPLEASTTPHLAFPRLHTLHLDCSHTASPSDLPDSVQRDILHADPGVAAQLRSLRALAVYLPDQQMWYGIAGLPGGDGGSQGGLGADVMDLAASGAGGAGLAAGEGTPEEEKEQELTQAQTEIRIHVHMAQRASPLSLAAQAAQLAAVFPVTEGARSLVRRCTLHVARPVRLDAVGLLREALEHFPRCEAVAVVEEEGRGVGWTGESTLRNVVRARCPDAEMESVGGSEGYVFGREQMERLVRA